MSGGEHQLLLAAIAELGCTRLDVVERVGADLGFDGSAEDLAALDGVAVSDDRVLVDPQRIDTVALDADVLRRAARAAAEQHLAADDDLEEVGRLAIEAALPDLLATAVRRTLRSEPPKVTAAVLRTWRDAGVLEDGDPHQAWLAAACAAAAAGLPLPEVLESYEAVRARFEAAGDVDGELAVGMVAAVLARRTDDFGTVIRLIGRAQEMIAAGHLQAEPPTVLGDALRHQIAGDPLAALAALDRFPADWLEGDWAAQVLMMRGTNLLLLDRVDDAIEVLEGATGHGSTWTYATALELLGTARWNAGDRVGAIEDIGRAEVLARAIGAVGSATLAAAHLAVLQAADGRPEAAATARRASRPAAADSPPAEEIERLLAAAEILRQAGTGDVAGAARSAVALEVPTRAVRSAHWSVALRSALVGDETGELDAAARAHPSLGHALAAGAAGRAHLATGVPAPSRARRLLPSIWCEPEPPTVQVRLLGVPTVRHDGRDAAHPDWERARVRELCLHLALVSGSSRDQIAARLWPDLSREAAGRNLRVTLSYLLSVLEPGRAKGATSALVVDTAGTLALAVTPRLRIDVRDAARLAEQIHTAAAAGDTSSVVRAARHLVRVPGGRLLGGMAAGEWLEQADAARAEQALRASLAGGPVLLRTGHPALAEELAERGLVEDPWAERLHQVVVRARLARDDLDGARRGVRRALQALDELGVRPESATRELARLVGFERP